MTTTNDDSDNANSQMGDFGGRPGFFSHQGGFGGMRSQFGQRGWLRPALIKMLQEKPMNGMEIINRFYEASRGWWKPSPGSVYPLLETLETEELIKKRSDGRYEVTKKVSEAKKSGQVEEMLTNMEGTVSYFEDMAKSDKAKLAQYKNRMKKLSERISKL